MGVYNQKHDGENKFINQIFNSKSAVNQKEKDVDPNKYNKI